MEPCTVCLVMPLCVLVVNLWVMCMHHVEPLPHGCLNSAQEEGSMQEDESHIEQI